MTRSRIPPNCLLVDDELEFARPQDRKVGGLRAFERARPDVVLSFPPRRRPTAHETGPYMWWHRSPKAVSGDLFRVIGGAAAGDPQHSHRVHELPDPVGAS